MMNNYLETEMANNIYLGGKTYLERVAKCIVYYLRKNGFPADDGLRQTLCLAEEAGEFVGAYRRWKGMARHNGTEQEAQKELADVIITAYVMAIEMRWDITTIIEEKFEEIMNRGWKEYTNDAS